MFQPLPLHTESLFGTAFIRYNRLSWSVPLLAQLVAALRLPHLGKVLHACEGQGPLCSLQVACPVLFYLLVTAAISFRKGSACGLDTFFLIKMSVGLTFEP